jgi:hypothetical protein
LLETQLETMLHFINILLIWVVAKNFDLRAIF